VLGERAWGKENEMLETKKAATTKEIRSVEHAICIV
jgi:hypothetical protein